MKKKIRRKRGAFICLCALFLGFGAVLSAYATNADLEDTKKKISSLEEEKKKMESTISQLEGLKSDAAAYVRELDNSLAALASELDDLEKDISEKEGQIEEMGQKLSAAKAQEEEQYQDMKLRIRYMYENGEVSALDAIMQSGSISELLSRADYASQIAAYDRKMLKQYQATKEEVERREQELIAEHEALKELQASTEAKQASVQTLYDKKQTELAAYNSQISTAQGALAQYEEDLKAQEAQMKKIEEEMRRREEEARKKAEAAGEKYTVSNLGNISFMWPCPSSSRITSNFGDRESPTEGASTNHKGIDIGAASGSDIVAAADGQVVISTYSYSAGNYIMIDHGGGVSTVYMHCSQLLVGKGAQVKKGQVIAKVGSTGYSTGPHLHFGIRSGGTYVNPRSYVSP